MISYFKFSVSLSQPFYEIEEFWVSSKASKIETYENNTIYIYIWVWPSSLQSILRVSVLILLFHTVFLNDLGSTTSFSPGPSYPSNPTSPGQPRALPCIWRMYRKQPLDRVYTSHFKWQVPSQFHINAVCFSVIPATVELASGLTFKEPKCLHDKLKNSMPCVDLAMEGQGYVVWEEVECLRGCREKRVQDQRASSLFFLNSSSHLNLLVMSMAAGKHLLSGKRRHCLARPALRMHPSNSPLPHPIHHTQNASHWPSSSPAGRRKIDLFVYRGKESEGSEKELKKRKRQRWE